MKHNAPLQFDRLYSFLVLPFNRSCHPSMKSSLLDELPDSRRIYSTSLTVYSRSFILKVLPASTTDLEPSNRFPWSRVRSPGIPRLRSHSSLRKIESIPRLVLRICILRIQWLLPCRDFWCVVQPRFIGSDAPRPVRRLSTP